MPESRIVEKLEKRLLLYRSPKARTTVIGLGDLSYLVHEVKKLRLKLQDLEKRVKMQRHMRRYFHG